MALVREDDTKLYEGAVLEYPIYAYIGGEMDEIYARVWDGDKPLLISCGFGGYGNYTHNLTATVDATAEIQEMYTAWQHLQADKARIAHENEQALKIASGKKVQVVKGKKCKGEIFTITKIYEGAYGEFVRHGDNCISVKNLQVVV